MAFMSHVVHFIDVETVDSQPSAAETMIFVEIKTDHLSQNEIYFLVFAI